MSIKRKRLFYDIETSFCEGHFWRAGWNQTILPHQIIKYPQIMTISWKWEDDEQIHHLDWGLKKQCDKKLLKKFIKELDKADEIVAHNGDRFDIKWIRTRALFHGLEMKHTYPSIDTLKLCKKYLNLPSNKLSEVAKYFNVQQKRDAGGITTWMNIIFNKDQEALDHMHFYCDGDVETLEQVYQKLKPYTQHKTNYAVLRGGEKFDCPECGKLPYHNKTRTTAAGTIQHYMKCGSKDGCKTYFKINNKTYMDYIKFKIRNNIK
jgi:predicted PolB exonuclease-like 3'-5' exonuclease